MSASQEFKLSSPCHLGEALQEASAHLRRAGKSTPQLDARVILCSCLSIDPAHLIAHPGDVVPELMISRLEEMIKRRAAHEPVAYITGNKEFFGRKFLVDRRVLIPRPETETLVEAALPLLGDGKRILDVGAGSGCVAITLALEAAGRGMSVTVAGLDMSLDALEVAKNNAERLGAPVEFVCADIRDYGTLLKAGPFDLIVSNPPYVASPEIPLLEPGVREYEPLSALDGGSDGLEVIRSILQAAGWGLLTENGWILLEIGAGQFGVLGELQEGANIRYHSIIKDLAGVDRVVLFGRQS